MRARRFRCCVVAVLCAVGFHPNDVRADETESCVAVTSENLVRCALAASLPSRREHEGIRVVEGRVDAARPWLPSNPQISVGMGFRQSSPVESRATNWSVALSQEMAIAGQRGARVRATEGELLAQKWRTIATEREAAQLAWAAFYEALSTTKELDLAFRIERASSLVATTTRARADKGVVATIDADLAEIVYLKFVQARIESERRSQAARVTLSTFVGLDPVRQVATVNGELAPLPNVTTRARTLLDSNNYERPDISALQAEGHAFEAKADSFRRTRVPNVTVLLTAQNDGLYDQRTYGVGVSVPVPLLQPIGRTYRGEIAEAEALSRRANLDAARLTRDVRLQIVTSLQAYDARRAELDTFAPERLLRAEAALGDISRGVETGRLAIRDTLLSVQTLIEFLRGYIETQKSLCLASIDVARAAGLPLERVTP
jgi:outer membrane protein, heavy metal efflux system